MQSSDLECQCLCNIKHTRYTSDLSCGGCHVRIQAINQRVMSVTWTRTWNPEWNTKIFNLKKKTKHFQQIQLLNFLTTVGYLLGVFFRLWDTFFGPYFHFCLELALETWAKVSLSNSLWVYDLNHTHSLVSFQWSGLSDQQTLLLTENCLQYQKWCHYKGRGMVSTPLC